jgi:predicted nucleic-acid-binding protein
MRAIDTNALVRLVTRDEARQVDTAEAFVQKGAWVSQLALAEATWALSAVYDLNAAAIATAIEMLLNLKDLTLEESEVVAGALGIFRGRPGLGFSVCLTLEVARKAGHLLLGTFARNLGKQAGVERL